MADLDLALSDWLWPTIYSHPQPVVAFCLLAKEMELIKVLLVLDIDLYEMLALDLFYIRNYLHNQLDQWLSP